MGIGGNHRQLPSIFLTKSSAAAHNHSQYVFTYFYLFVVPDMLNLRLPTHAGVMARVGGEFHT